jgi:hypothetical protein
MIEPEDELPEDRAQGPEDTPPNASAGQAALLQTELEQLRMRIIALENVVIALLAQGPEAQRVLAREMATYISPRPGATPHPLTLRAAVEMRSLVDRASPFQAPPLA